MKGKAASEGAGEQRNADDEGEGRAKGQDRGDRRTNRRRLASVPACPARGLKRRGRGTPRRVSEFAALNMVDSRIGCAVAGRYGPHHRPADYTRSTVYQPSCGMFHLSLSLSLPPCLSAALTATLNLPMFPLTHPCFVSWGPFKRHATMAREFWYTRIRG